MARTARVLGLTLASALTATALSVTGPTALAGSATPVSAGDGQTPSGDVRRMVYVGNNWDGTADLRRSGELRAQGAAGHRPGQGRADGRDPRQPRPAGLLPRDPRGDRRGPRPVRRRHVLHQRRQAARRLAAELRRRRRDQPAHREDQLAVRGRRLPLGPHGDLAGRRRVAVSASTADVVHVLRTSDGKEIGRFATGGSPHENVYIDGGRKILHASIGMVYSPLDRAEADATKGERVIQIVDAKTFQILRRINVRKALDARGHDPGEPRGTPADAVAGRAHDLLPGLVLPRLPGDEPPHRRRSPASSGCRT